MTSNNTSDTKRFIKFSIVGISGTVVDFFIFNLLSSILGFPTVPSSVVSFIVAVFNNFFWNRHWTYPESKDFPFSEQFGKFGIVSLIGLIIRTIIFSKIENPLIHLSEVYFAQIKITPEVIGHNLALAIVIVIVLFWNYFANKLWTYKGIKEAAK
ncbi:GtrA family protein [Pelolinea submarina]|uniref:Putative flippase GtrA n=1 Tax=Pelolinea submarina TaxID=913107 RepID=A0A347ZT71_9CHLR|nr:GtrA family protein [Pelolinea submarina]REG10923.1 putative flippase GtrA [Pelolinea submarina]BBB48502.1 dolichol-phosphate mannosyltransferase [Pelolinea submarina]